ncbi:TPA: ABC-three component system middle component 1, partial [Streptococcus suis]
EFYNQNLNTILTIEEDEYYFRKYVIFYTEEGLDKLNPDIQWLLRYIRGNGNDSDEESLFDKFERNMFFDDAYFIAMQLIIKLPFISLPHSNDHFETIEDKIKLRIGTAELVDQEQQVDQILGLFHDDNINIGSQLEDTTIIDSLRQILEE